MVQFRIVAFILLPAIFVFLSNGQITDEQAKRITARVDRMICIGGKYVEFKTCQVKLKSATSSVLNWEAILKKTLTAVNVHIKTFYKFSNNEYRPIGIDTTVDYCAPRSGAITSIMFDTLDRVYRNYSNFFNKECPVAPGLTYVRNFTFEARHLPSIVPGGKYLFNFTFFMQGNEVYANILGYITVVNYNLGEFSWNFK